MSFCHLHSHPSRSSHPPATPAPPHKPNYAAFTSSEMELPKICSSFKICLQSSHSSAVLPSHRQDVLRKKDGDTGYQSFGLVFCGVLILCPPPLSPPSIVLSCSLMQSHGEHREKLGSPVSAAESKSFKTLSFAGAKLGP